MLSLQNESSAGSMCWVGPCSRIGTCRNPLLGHGGSGYGLDTILFVYTKPLGIVAEVVTLPFSFLVDFSGIFVEYLYLKSC